MREKETGTFADALTSKKATISTSDNIEVSEDEELGNFLWDALTDYDPNLTDLADLCA